MRHDVITFTTVLATSFISSLAFAGDALTIREIAPQNSMLVIGADDVRGTLDRLTPTAFGKLWNDPALADDVKTFRAEIEKGIVEAASEAGIERETITWPSSLGFAVTADIDEELGMPSLHYMFFCDWSGEAEGSSKMLEAFIANMEKAEKSAGSVVSTDEVRGRHVLVMKSPESEDESAEDGMGEEGADEFDPMGGMGIPDIMPSGFCIVCDKGRLFATDSLESMDTLLARVDGDHAKSVGEDSTFQGAMELSGGTSDLYAMFSLEAAKPMLATLPPYMIAEPFIKRLIGDVKAISVGMHARDGVIEQCAGVYVPAGKVGLLSLIDQSTEFTAPPAVVPSDAMSYGRLNVRFEKIVPMLDEIVSSLPADQGEMIAPMMDMWRPAMVAAFGVMGPEVHFWSNAGDAADPLASTSVTAISMKNDKDSAAAVSDFVSLLPLGLQPRDFNGMTILSDEFSPMAIGMGGGYVAAGEVKQVEQTLRSVDAKGEAGLAGDESFKSSMSLLPKGGVVGCWWWDFGRQMQETATMFSGMTDELADMSGVGDAAEVPGLGVGLDDADAFYKLMNPEVVKRCFGDAIMEITSTNAGYGLRYRMLPAASN